MAPKKPPPPAGAPEWLVTYGDMMTLLLCFFVLLFAFSTIDPQQYVSVAGSLRETLEGTPTAREVIAEVEEVNDLQIKLERLSRQAPGQVFRAGPYNIMIEALRDGYVLRVGGKALFDQGSAVIREDAFDVMQQLHKLIQGTRNEIEIRGHTSNDLDDAASGSLGKWDLSWQRAHSVLEYLLSKGENPKRFFLAGYSRFDPVETNLSEFEREQNRRFELIVRPVRRGD